MSDVGAELFEELKHPETRKSTEGGLSATKGIQGCKAKDRKERPTADLSTSLGNLGGKTKLSGQKRENHRANTKKKGKHRKPIPRQYTNITTAPNTHRKNTKKTKKSHCNL